ncbi:replication protein [Halomonas eurihalina]|uniref:Replication protein n=1 Tax=Halomonas eurihalina TaxID=42566 RepID=A0A5D9DCZ3_HALER|nr:replication protein [Halomonas eurihalina]MDR5859428.1 replication protein [Halomonas eurihalina]TZG40535.1 replication protein [Halomonas eurihalina]
MADTAEIYQFPGRENGPQPDPERTGRSIQVEDGFTRTANPLVEAFARSPLTSREARVIRVVERMTYGWNKAEDWIAASVISEMTGMSEGKCSETLNGLIRKRVLIRNGGGRSPVRINKDIDQWDFTAQKSRVTPKRKAETNWGKSPQDGISESPQNGDTPKDRKDTPPLPSVEGEGESPKSGQASRPTKPKTTRLDLSNLPAEVSTEAVQGFIEHRKALKKPLTQRALTLNVNEALRAAERIPELTADQALDETVLAGWQGVKADWLANRLNGRGRSAPRQNGRVGMAQPKAQGTYTPTDTTNLPDWMRD